MSPRDIRRHWQTLRYHFSQTNPNKNCRPKIFTNYKAHEIATDLPFHFLSFQSQHEVGQEGMSWEILCPKVLSMCTRWSGWERGRGESWNRLFSIGRQTKFSTAPSSPNTSKAIFLLTNFVLFSLGENAICVPGQQSMSWSFVAPGCLLLSTS